MTYEKFARITFDLVEHLDDMVAYWDSDRRCGFVNSAYKHWFGRGRSELIGVPMEELLGPLYKQNLRFIDAAYAGEKQIFERDIPTPDGSIRSTLATYIPRLEGGHVQGIYVLVVDVTALKRIERELTEAKLEAERRATHDILTGLPNRAHLHDRIRGLVARASAKDSFGVITIDIDGFKKVNDTFGHAVGDSFLIEMAARFKKFVRASDTVIRLAGDEFLVLVSLVEDPSEIDKVADRILAGVQDPFLEGGHILPSVSLGVAHFPRDATTPEDLIVVSDRALYDAKRRRKISRAPDE